jgi:hypothetical protein
MSEVPSQSVNDGAGRYKEQVTPEQVSAHYLIGCFAP